ncbi:MAG: uracil-DNA glycosylase [Rhizobiaceae bacterium]
MGNTQEILEWYVDAGVDVMLEEQPIDRFAETAAAASAKSENSKSTPKQRSLKRAPAPKPAAAQATIPDTETINSAREIAQKADSLDALRELIESFDGCNLKRTAKTTVFADGNPNAGLMLIGEAPGRDEDIQGLPFVGRAGQLLDRILQAINLDRNSVYITNIINWRPPGNRTPTPQETEICRPFIERHIELANPELIVMLGGSSAKTLLKTNDGIMRLRGKWAEVATSGSRKEAMPTLHPAYLLRQPAHKKLVWQDFLKIKKKLDSKS